VQRRSDAQRDFRTAQDPTYAYADIRVPYRSETLRVSKCETERLRDWLSVESGARSGTSGIPPVPPDAKRRPRKIILDTDIGTDVDDALALLLLLELPRDDVELLGITTVYGYSHVRAAVAERILRAFEEERGCRQPISILAGESTPLGTHRPVWHTGTEGAGVLAEGEVKSLQAHADFVVANGRAIVPVTTAAAEAGRHAAARWIAEQTWRWPGAVTVVSIGQLTNLAVALLADPAMKDRVERVVHMAVGDRMHVPLNDLPCPGAEAAWFHHSNHNVSGDTLAAMRVYGSGMRIDVVPHAVTDQLWWGETPSAWRADGVLAAGRDACRALLDATRPRHAAAVGALLKVWLDYRSGIFGIPICGTCPHDALTVAEAVYPGRFLDLSAPGHLMIHEWAGFATFVPAPRGPHRLATGVRARGFLEFLSETMPP